MFLEMVVALFGSQGDYSNETSLFWALFDQDLTLIKLKKDDYITTFLVPRAKK